MARESEQWKDVPGFEGRYQASFQGHVRRVNGNGTYLVLKPFIRKSSKNKRAQKVWLIRPDGKRIERAVLAVIAAAWCPPPPGYRVVHRNGMFSDNSATNVRFMRPRDMPHLYPNRQSRRSVVKLDKDGNILKIYSSAAQAAKEEYISHSTLVSHCNGKVSQPRITDGLLFRWAEDGMMEGDAITYRQPCVVRKIGEDGKVVAEYQSVMEAATANGVGKTSVYKQCNDEIQHPKGIGDCRFAWGPDAKPRKGGKRK